MKCSDCKHWKPRGRYETGHSQGMGSCEATPMFWDHTEWNDDGERVIKPTAANITAFVQDGSDYSAALYTRPEHGCTMFVARGVPAPGQQTKPQQTPIPGKSRLSALGEE